MIPHEYIEELTRRTDIVELVGSYVQLKRKGRLYGGLCPFHSEKSPSFYVYPDTQSFYCFGCGAGGDAITFAKKINSIDYPEAVKMLAARAGMPEPQEDDKTGRMRSRILSMNKEAARFFHACLNSTVEEARQARAYWRRRGLDDKTIVRFGLGYAPNDGQALYQFLRDKGYNQQELDASGLFKRSPSGRIYCLFWKRVMTPIFDLRGNIIAFGGRVLDDSKPKYVNSPETLVYHKSDTVFALQIAKRSASRRFVLCEGYMDVISMQQAGIDTAVCACGTALTPDQVRLISEYADEVILSYDSDEAGQKATLRSLELFRNSPVKVGVLQIPGAKDPDEYIKKYGAERFKALLDGVGNALDFRLGRLRSQYDLSQDAQRLEYVKQAVYLLAERSSPTEQEVYAGRLAEEKKHVGFFGQLIEHFAHCAQTEDVSTLAYSLYAFYNCCRSEILDDRTHSCLARELAGLISGDAVVCARIAQRAVIHRRGNVTVKLCSALDHGDHQTSCSRSPSLIAGASGNGTDMAAHPAESACIGLSGTVFRKHIKTSLSQ